MREAVFAKQGWYPEDPQSLSQLIQKELSQSRPSPLPQGSIIRGVISPHAGYLFSLNTACHAFRFLEGQDFANVFVLGPSHRSTCQGKVTLCQFGAYETPLGYLPVNLALVKRLVESDPQLFAVNDAIHSGEHSLEMEMPLIFHQLGAVPIVPIVIPSLGLDTLLQTGEQLASVLGENDLLVISTDLSHFPTDEDAQNIDQEAMNSWLSLDPQEIWEMEARFADTPQTSCAMCGLAAIVVGVHALRKRFAKPTLTLQHHSTSAEVTGDTARVVGYGSAVITSP